MVFFWHKLKQNWSKTKATGVSTKNGKVVLVPVLAVQKLSQNFERCACPKSNIGPYLKRKILTFHIAINVGFSRFRGKWRAENVICCLKSDLWATSEFSKLTALSDGTVGSLKAERFLITFRLESSVFKTKTLTSILTGQLEKKITPCLLCFEAVFNLFFLFHCILLFFKPITWY